MKFTNPNSLFGWVSSLAKTTAAVAGLATITGRASTFSRKNRIKSTLQPIPARRGGAAIGTDPVTSRASRSIGAF